jgi:oligopeptide transport system substrate-binding protein
MWESQTGDMNYSRWTDPAFDAAMEAAKFALDPQERQARYGDAERMLMEETPHAFVYVGASYAFVRPEITGWTQNALGANPSRTLCRAATSGQ